MENQPTKKKPFEIRFLKNVFWEYAKRMGEIDSSHIEVCDNEPHIKILELEKEIRRGVVYVDEERMGKIPVKGSPNIPIYIIYNNLKVYKGVIHCNTGYVRIVTCYPYRQSLREMLVRSERISIEDFV